MCNGSIVDSLKHKSPTLREALASRWSREYLLIAGKRYAYLTKPVLTFLPTAKTAVLRPFARRSRPVRTTEPKPAWTEGTVNPKSGYHPRIPVGRVSQEAAIRITKYDWPKGYRKWGEL